MNLRILSALATLLPLSTGAPQLSPMTARLYGDGSRVFPAGWLASGDLLVTEVTKDGLPRIVVVASDGLVIASIPGPSAQTWAGDPHPVAAHFLAESYLGGVSDLYVLDLAGRVVNRVTETPWNEWHPAWSPDGSRIVYDSDSARAPRLVIDGPLGGERRLATTAPGAEQGGSWSPDGSMLAFHRLMPGGTTNYDIVILDIASGRERMLTSGIDDSSSPSWSPDGTRVTFSSNRSGQHQLYVACANGEGEPVRIDGPAADSKYPKWSRDGSSIAFQVLNDGIWTARPPAEQGCQSPKPPRS